MDDEELKRLEEMQKAKKKVVEKVAEKKVVVEKKVEEKIVEKKVEEKIVEKSEKIVEKIEKKINKSKKEEVLERIRGLGLTLEEERYDNMFQLEYYGKSYANAENLARGLYKNELTQTREKESKSTETEKM